MVSLPSCPTSFPPWRADGKRLDPMFHPVRDTEPEHCVSCGLITCAPQARGHHDRIATYDARIGFDKEFA